MSTERQAEPTPSQGDEVQDEFSRISEETFQITEDFMSQLETNITNDLKGYESYFENAKDSIYDEVEKEVRSTLEAEIARRKREGRTGGLMESVRVFPKKVIVEDGVIEFKDMSVYGEGWTGKRTFFDMTFAETLPESGAGGR